MRKPRPADARYSYSYHSERTAIPHHVENGIRHPKGSNDVETLRVTTIDLAYAPPPIQTAKPKQKSRLMVVIAETRRVARGSRMRLSLTLAHNLCCDAASNEPIDIRILPGMQRTGMLNLHRVFHNKESTPFAVLRRGIGLANTDSVIMRLQSDWIYFRHPRRLYVAHR